jgi:sodium/bile acid cotransporter 3/5
MFILFFKTATVFFFLKFAFGVAKLMIDDPLMGFGLLVIGVCPGGIASNFWTLLLDGDVNLSITMTFVSSIAAMGQYSTFLFDRQNQD